MPKLEDAQICTNVHSISMCSPGKTDDQLMYLENNDDADAWLVIDEENSSS